MPSALTISVIEVLHSSIQRENIVPSMVNVWLWRGESYTCCNLLPIHYSHSVSDLVPTRS